MIEIGPATYEDALFVADHMRAVDVRELRDMNDTGPLAAVAEAMRVDGEVLAARLDGEPVALFGCARMSVLGNAGSPWLLGTDALERCARPLVALGRAKVAEWIRTYDLLENVVDARNVRTIGWLKRIGFSFGEPIEVKPGVLAVRFWKEGV